MALKPEVVKFLNEHLAKNPPSTFLQYEAAGKEARIKTTNSSNYYYHKNKPAKPTAPENSATAGSISEATWTYLRNFIKENPDRSYGGYETSLKGANQKTKVPSYTFYTERKKLLTGKTTSYKHAKKGAIKGQRFLSADAIDALGSYLRDHSVAPSYAEFLRLTAKVNHVSRSCFDRYRKNPGTLPAPEDAGKRSCTPRVSAAIYQRIWQTEKVDNFPYEVVQSMLDAITAITKQRFELVELARPRSIQLNGITK